MGDALPIADRAEILADSLGISPGSYAGRERDAVLAMSFLAGYRTLEREDQVQVLYIIRDKMAFGDTHPGFFRACQGALSLIVANPVWVPGSLTNGELEQEIAVWRAVLSVVKAAGFAGVGQTLAAHGRSVFEKMNLKTLMPNRQSGLLVLGTTVHQIATSTLQVLHAEVRRRGLTGAMTPLHVAEFSQ